MSVAIGSLRRGQMVRLHGGATACVTSEFPADHKVQVRYLESPGEPSLVGREFPCDIDAILSIINPYTMTISRLTVDKLGVKLYDRVSAVLAELVANSYDADATEVLITAPMDQLLATKQGQAVADSGYTIEIQDNGIGMTPDEVRKYYLIVGAERRADSERGNISRGFKRKVMGRKGVGKLAPFGIAQRIELLSSGGKPVDGIDAEGKPANGYKTAHLILDRDAILSPTDEEYHAEVGDLDGCVRPTHGTLLRLSHFSHRRVPGIEDLARQLSQRFGIASADWQVVLVDSQTPATDPNHSRTVGRFQVALNLATLFRFDTEKDEAGNEKVPSRPVAYGPDGKPKNDMSATIVWEGRGYPVRGWIAYAKEPYKDDLMAGVRIYCRGKIAAQTNIFNLKAGFHGEYDIRSYLVGELHADWLDEEEDLIQTDRRDILWSHELGRAFEQWGQDLVRIMGRHSRQPMREKAWDTFKESSKIEQRVQSAFPVEDQEAIRDNALELARFIGRTAREDELNDPDTREALVQLSLNFAPHITLDRKLRQAAEAKDTPLAVITGILKAARVAELSSFGQIADERVRVIVRVEALKDDPTTIEAALQNLISNAPWLIDPQWSPISANQTFSTLKTEFEKYYRKQTNEILELGDFNDPSKRADFIMSSQNGIIEIIEIKRPHHLFQNEEMQRLDKYIEVMTNFLDDAANEEFRRLFPRRFHVTLVCDGESLSGVYKRAFDGLMQSGTLDHINWRSFLLRTRMTHQAFLDEAERQRKNAARADE